MVFQPGQSGNPKGYNGPRHTSNRHRVHREVAEQIKALGHKDALLTLSEIQNDPTKDDNLRVSAAGLLAPFQHPKLQAIPTARFIENPIDVPDLQTIEDAESFLAKIAVSTARGELDFQSALELSTIVKAWIDSKNAHTTIDLKAVAQNATDGDQVIRIEGGLPSLPGTNVTMPRLEHGANVNGYPLLEPSTLNPSTIDGVHEATPNESSPNETTSQEPT
jgi:hypothetical protein